MDTTKSLNSLIKVLKEKNLLIKTVNLRDKAIRIRKLTYNSRQVEPGTLFFCKGIHFKSEYLKLALEEGALAYISEIEYDVDLPHIIVKDIRIAMSHLAAFFYNYPDRKLKMIGVTGSKGKSTTVLYIKKILDDWLSSQSKKPCGVMSTISVYNGENTFEPTLTTPEALELYQHLNTAVKSNLEFFVMEISSQALKYNRVLGVDYDLVCLLNIGRDHISPNEHPDFEDYIQSKLSIFSLAPHAFYNKSIDFLPRVEKAIADAGLAAHSFSAVDKSADYYPTNIYYQKEDCYFTQNNIEYSLPTISLYNVENALCAIAVAKFFQVPEEIIAKALKTIVIPGRDQFFYTVDNKIIAYVSYAHNQLSFEKSYQTILQHFPEYKIVSLFGASGNKGLNRIQDLPAVAGPNSDFIYFIPDDPGYRKHEEIAKEMALYLPDHSCNYKITETREAAIKEAFAKAKQSEKKTLLFIAGKGEEHYQMIGDKAELIPSDLEISEKLVTDYNLLYES